MRKLPHLLWRELRDQRFVLLAAPLLGLLPGLMVKLVGLNATAAEDSRRWVARLLVYGVLLVAVTVVGARWLVAGFGDGRRAFELARPLSAGQLWVSKLVASLALVFGVTALVGLPSGAAIWQKAPGVDAEILSWLGEVPLVGKLSDFLVRGGNQPAGSWLASQAFGVLLVMVAVQSLAFLMAARSWRSLADLAAWVAAGTLFTAAYLRLVQAGGLDLAGAWLVPAGLAILALGALASRRSFGAGVLLREGHSRYALVTNLGLVALALVMIAAAGWR